MPATPHEARTISGTAFAIAAIAAAALFVAFLVFVSPVLLERTLERVPPAAPHTVAEGADWEAVATQPDEDTGCLEITTPGGRQEICTSVRGAPVRVVDAAALGDGHVAHGIVDARTTHVALELADSEVLRLDVVHVDFGFPLGFFATDLEAGAGVTRIVAFDRDDVARAEATCGGQPPTEGACDITDLR